MAKTCIYCGSELAAGQKCTCAGSVSRSSAGADFSDKDSSARHSASGDGRSSGNAQSSAGNRNDEKEHARRMKERAREQARKDREKAKEQARFTRKATGSGSIRNFFFKLMTSRGFSKGDSLASKLGMSFLQTLFKPVTAAEAFVRNRDNTISMIYAVLFSASFSLALMRLRTFGLLQFGEGLLFGAAAFLLLNALFLLTFRFLLKVKYTFPQLIAAFCPSAIYMSVFILIASAGQTGAVTFFMTLISGLIASVLLHFVSLKAMTGQSTERLLVNTIFVYFLFFMIFGMVASLAAYSPAAASGL
ncbi:MAG: hypothetical protein ACYCYM_02460 [Saccharofermentanales bacterium]